MHELDQLDREASAASALGVGHGANSDPRRAATEALTDALAGRQPRDGDLVLVFADVMNDARTVMHALVEAAAPATVVGCSSQGSFSTATAGPHTLSVIYLPAGDLRTGVATVATVDGDLRAAAREAARSARADADPVHPHSVLLVVSPATPNQRDVVRGAYEVTGARVPLVGGAAASNPEMSATWHGNGDTIVEDGVTAVWLNSPRPFGLAVDHGWRPVSGPLVVTRASGNVVYELDGRPAYEAYLEARGRHLSDPDVHLQWESADLPLGLPTINGGYEVRHIWDRTDDGGLRMYGSVHDQAVVRVMSGHASELLEGARRAVHEAVYRLDRPARGALVFSCKARLALFGDAADEERRAIGEQLGAVPAAGFFTSGEYCRLTGSTGFHNASVVVLAL